MLKLAIFLSMKIVNQNNTTHNIKFVPRYYPTGIINVHLYNESSGEFFVENCIYSVLDGYLFLTFDFNFINKDRFSFKVMENNNVVYRGKIFSTIEETQNYKQSTYLYEY